MTRETSRAAYERLVATGLLQGKQRSIMGLLVEMGPATSGEVLARIRGIRNVNAWRARFTELQQRGLIREIGVRPCRISGRECIVWAPTGRDRPLDEGAGTGGKVALSARKRGQWQSCAQQLAAVVAQLRQLEDTANTAHLRTAASRALAEYSRLGGTVPA